jgi:hypothetical protein
VNRNDRHSAVGMTKYVVASLDADNLETLATESGHQLTARDRREACHAATDTRWTPTNSNGEGVSPASR